MKTEKFSSESKKLGAHPANFGTTDARPECGRAAAFVSPANVLTSMRIALSGVMLLMEPLSARFFCVYGLAGFTDMIDGRIARKTGTDSGFGAMLDSAADLIFVVSAFVCLFPVYKEAVPPWLWMTVAFVAYLKLKNAIAGLVINRKIVTMHTLMNRLTGVALFVLPFACLWVPLPVYGGFCAGLAVVATVDGFVRLLRGSTKFDRRT